VKGCECVLRCEEELQRLTMKCVAAVRRRPRLPHENHVSTDCSRSVWLARLHGPFSSMSISYSYLTVFEFIQSVHRTLREHLTVSRLNWSRRWCKCVRWAQYRTVTALRVKNELFCNRTDHLKIDTFCRTTAFMLPYVGCVWKKVTRVVANSWKTCWNFCLEKVCPLELNRVSSGDLLWRCIVSFRMQ